MKKIIIPVLFVLVSACSEGKSVEQLLNEAIEYSEKNEFRSAEIALKNLLKIDSENGEARYQLALINLLNRDGVAAESNLNKALSAGYPKEKVADHLVEALFYQNKYEEVISHAYASSELSQTQSQRIFFFSGLSLIYLGKPEEAIESFKNASQSALSTPEAKMAAAYSAVLGQDWQKAKRMLDKLIIDQPNSDETNLLYGRYYKFQGKLQEAIPYLAKAVTFAPSRLSLHDELARLYFATGQYDLSAKHSREILERARNHLSSLLTITRISILNNRWKEADNLADNALKYHSSDKDARYLSGLINYQLKNWDKSLWRLKSVAHLFPDNHKIHRLIAYIEHKAGTVNPSDTLSTLKSPQIDDSRLFLRIAKEEAQAKNYQKALDNLHLAKSLDPNNAELLSHIGLIKLAMGEEGGESELIRSLAINEQDIITRVALIHSLVNLGRYAEATYQAEKLIELQPNQQIGYILLSFAHNAKGSPSEAIDALSRGLDNSNRKEHLHLAKARIFYQRKQFLEAEKDIHNVLNSDPRNVVGLLMLYRIYDSTGRSEEGFEILSRRAKEHPSEDGLVFLLMVINLQNNKLESARANYSTISANSDFRPKAASVLSSELIKRRKLDAAKSIAEDWIESSPEDEESYIALAHILVLKDQYQNALAAVERGLIKIPDSDTLIVNRFKTLLKIGEVEKAIKYKNSLEVNNYLSVTLERIAGQFYAQQEKYDQAIKHFKELYRLLPDSSSTRLYAEALIKFGDKDKALGIIAERLEKNPEDIFIRQLRADTLIGTSPKEAINEYKAIIELNQNNVSAINNLAWILGETGNTKEAIQYASLAYEMMPDSPAVQDTYGKLLHQSGQWEKALQLLRSAYDAKPDDMGITRNLAKALTDNGNHAEAAALLKKLE